MARTELYNARITSVEMETYDVDPDCACKEEGCK